MCGLTWPSRCFEQPTFASFASTHRLIENSASIPSSDTSNSGSSSGSTTTTDDNGRQGGQPTNKHATTVRHKPLARCSSISTGDGAIWGLRRGVACNKVTAGRIGSPDGVFLGYRVQGRKDEPESSRSQACGEAGLSGQTAWTRMWGLDSCNMTTTTGHPGCRMQETKQKRICVQRSHIN